VDNPLTRLRVSSVGNKIAAVCDRHDLLYHFKAIEDDEVNAFALPGGYVYVTSGLLEKVSDNDDELAAVLAHEVGHVVAKHSVKRIQAAMGYNLLSLLIVGATRDAKAQRMADIAFGQILLGYSRQDELLADRLAITYAERAGYNPEGMVTFLQKLKTMQKNRPLRRFFYLSTHPYISERISQARRIINKKMEFQDYINRPE
jgi:predicted Zn-dependent protease